MTMAQVAETVGVHETTVSRAIAGKTVATPQGVFEMKFFFTTGYVTAGGAEVSNMRPVPRGGRSTQGSALPRYAPPSGPACLCSSP